MKYRPEWEDSDEGHLLSCSRLLGCLCTPGGGGGLKVGGDSAGVDCTSSWGERICSTLIRGVKMCCAHYRAEKCNPINRISSGT